MRVEIETPTVADMEALGARLAVDIRNVQLVYLYGELGAGKTTLVRAILRALGYTGAIKSPTFTLIEPYSRDGFNAYHFDLYRVIDPEELEFLGFRDYVKKDSLCLVEWAERGSGVLPVSDIDVVIHRVNDERTVELMSHTDRGAQLLSGLT